MHLKDILLFTMFLCLFPSQGRAQKQQFVVTLDAGHGGTDYGAVGKKTNEKTITLDVAKRLGALIAEYCPDAKVVYTRTSDTFIPLADRAQIANRAASDLFISIHVNSVDRRNRNRTKIEGCQVYTLGLHKTAENLAVAKRENAVIELETQDTERYAGFDPNSLESDIVYELSQTHRMDQSIELADAVHTQLVSFAHREPKGVRQAGFWVLWATSMPSILVELDFICNPEAENYLKSTSGRQEMAEAVYNAFASYYNTYAPTLLGRDIALAPALAPSVNDKFELLAEETETSEHQNDKLPASDSTVRADTVTAPTSSQPIWKIQILASASQLPSSSSELRGLDNVSYYKDSSLYKYTVGEYASLDEAKTEISKVRQKFPQAFIIEIVDGKRVSFTK